MQSTGKLALTVPNPIRLDLNVTLHCFAVKPDQANNDAASGTGTGTETGYSSTATSVRTSLDACCPETEIEKVNVIKIQNLFQNNGEGSTLKQRHLARYNVK